MEEGPIQYMVWNNEHHNNHILVNHYYTSLNLLYPNYEAILKKSQKRYDYFIPQILLILSIMIWTA